MGSTCVPVSSAAPRSLDRGEEIDPLVETRAILGMIRQPILEHLGGAAVDREGARAFR